MTPQRLGPGANPAALPLGVAILVAAASGPVLDAAFPDRGWWPLAVVGVGLTLLALHGRRFGGGALVGGVAGAAFYYPHIEWATVFLGPVPWAALASVMTLWCALAGGLIAVAYRRMGAAFPGAAGRLLLVPAVVAGLWTAREAIASVWPYGGFSWGRVAMSQSESIIAPLFGWLGMSGVSFVVVFWAAVVVACLRERVMRDAAGRAASGVPGLARVTLVGGLLAVLVIVPGWPVPSPEHASEGSIRVGAVQGDTKAGYFDPPERRGDNLIRQYEATQPVFDAAADGEPVDVVVWPEGASDLDPVRNSSAAALFDEVVRRAQAPLVAGTITARTTGELDAAGDPLVRYYNTSLLWRAGEGVTDFYDKKHPVPFGEYVPDRGFWRLFAPELIDLIQREYTPGTTDMVLDVGGEGRLAGRSVPAGIAICFDIVDDQLMRDAVTDGAQLILAQTNNADFGRTDESVQQLAFARIRAIELGRTVVNISTVGTSAIVLPDGSTLDRLPWYTPGVMIADVPLATTVTPAVAIGRQLEWLASAFGLGGLLVALAVTRRRRRQAVFLPPVS